MKKNNKTFTSFLLFLYLIMGANFAQNQSWADDQKSELGFRLIFSRYPDVPFNPQQNIFKPSERQIAKDKVIEALSSAAIVSIFPLISKGREVLGQVVEKEEKSYLKALTHVASIMQDSIKKELEKMKTDPQFKSILNEVVIHDTFFVPWERALGNDFYLGHKVTTSSVRDIKTFSPDAGSEAFDRILTKHIKAYQKIINKEGASAVNLLGLKQFFFIQPLGESRLTLRVLLGIKANPNLVHNFDQKSPPVHLNKIVIPECGEEGIATSLTFNFNLNNPQEKPNVDIAFGKFVEFKDGKFVVDTQIKDPNTNTAYGPRLQGYVDKPALRSVGLHFTFTELNLDLTQMQLTSVRTLVSPGIIIGGTNRVLFSLENDEVSRQFKEEINKTIKAEINKALDKILSFGGGAR